MFFAVSFNLIVLTNDLILADYRASFGNFMVATMAALVVGKAVLVANATPFLRRFDTAPKDQQARANQFGNERLLEKWVPPRLM